MAIKNVGVKRLQGTKADRVSDSLGNPATGTNNYDGVSLISDSTSINWNGAGDCDVTATSIKKKSTVGSDWDVKAYTTEQCKSGGTITTTFKSNDIASTGSTGWWVAFGTDAEQYGYSPDPAWFMKGDGKAGITLSNGNEEGSGHTITTSSVLKMVYTFGTGASTGECKWYIDDVLKHTESSITNPTHKTLNFSSYVADKGVNTLTLTIDNDAKLGTGCYDYDGSGDKTTIGTSTTLSFLTDGSTDWTIAFWMKLNATEPNGNNAIFCQGQGNEQGLDILFDDRSAESRDHVLGVRMEGVGGHTPLKLYTGAQFIPKDTNWHHYVITADISTRTITAYRDNANAVSDSTGSGTFPSASDLDAPMTFGYHPSGGFGDLNAKLDDCGIWSRILTSDERTSLWNSGNGALVSSLSNKSGLKAYYNFDSMEGVPADLDTDVTQGFTQVGTSTTMDGNGKVTIGNGGGRLYKLLPQGITSTDKWNIWFDIKQTSTGTVQNSAFPISLTDNTNEVAYSGASISQEGHGIVVTNSQIEVYKKTGTTHNNTGGSTARNFTQNTWYYCFIRRNGESFDLSAFGSAADRLNDENRLWNINFVGNPSTGITGLKYLIFQGRSDSAGTSGANHQFEVDNIKVYVSGNRHEGIFGAGNIASKVSDLDNLTGVRTNTIFEETDASATNISDLTSSMILQYNFDETSGVTLNDQVGSVDGELKDGSLVNVDGVVGKGWRFDDTKVQIDQSLGTVSNISLSIWVKKFDGDRCPIAIDSSTSNFGTGLWFEDAVGSLGLRIGHQSSGTDLNTQTSIPQDGEFHHLVFIAGSDEARIYLDGVSIGNNSGTHSSGAYGGALELAYNGSSSIYGNCALDEARWFNKKLSQAEVTALYNNPDRFYWWYDGTNWVVGD